MCRKRDISTHKCDAGSLKIMCQMIAFNDALQYAY